MTSETPDKATQIEALIHRRARELVERSTPPDLSSAESYRRVFTVTRKEVEEYTKEHYKFGDLANTSPGSGDGFYAIQISDGYLTYDQERGIQFDKVVVDSENDVWGLVIDYLLARSGTGLKFS